MDIDITILFHFGLLMVVLTYVSNILLKPLFKVIEERERKIEGANEEVDQMRKEGDANMETYQGRMRDARVEASGAREALKNEGRDEQRKLLAAAREEIAGKLNDARVQVSEAEIAAKSKLKDDTQALAKSLVEKVLGRGVAA